MTTAATIDYSKHFLSFVIAEVIAVIVYNLKRNKMFSLSSYNCRRQHNSRPQCISVIGTLVLSLALSATVTTALSSQATTPPAPPANNVIAITHAAGRMGKVLALQLREDAYLRYQSRWVSGEFDEEQTDRDLYLPKIRAIVRSDKEAYAVQCDLGGMKMVSGCIAKPIAQPWLETIVIDESLSEKDRQAKLRGAFDGCRAAILCDASHNELVWNEDDCVVADPADDCGSFEMVVPAAESADLSKRLLEEIDAATHSETLEHVVLRSTMGLAIGDSNPELAEAMGGEAAVAGPRAAEAAFRESSVMLPNRKHTILRLGALTDDAGMVPMVFSGGDDAILVKTADDGTKNRRPPILSRADAARVSTVLVRADGDDDSDAQKALKSNLMTVDCAWLHKFGRQSVGREEVVSEAARQDIMGAIYEAVGEPVAAASN